MAIGSVAADRPVPTSPSYTTAAEVASIMGITPPTDANDEGEPTLTRFNQVILRHEEEVDRVTGTSYRIRQVLLEYHDWTTWIDEEGYYLVQLRHPGVRTLAAGQGDALEVWNGGSWEDWLATRQEGRQRDYWLQEPEGYLRLRRLTVPLTREARLRTSYRYGESVVPASIAHATALLAASTLIVNDVTAGAGMGGAAVDRVAAKEKRAEWRREAYGILASHQGVGRGY